MPKCAYSFVGVATPFKLNPRCRWFVSGDPPPGMKYLTQLQKSQDALIISSLSYCLQDDECFDLLLGGLALAFVLSLASVIPIIYICKMSECAHRGDNATVVTRQRLFRSFKP